MQNPTIPDMDMQDDDLDNMEVTMETVTMTAESTTASEAKDDDSSTIILAQMKMIRSVIRIAGKEEC